MPGTDTASSNPNAATKATATIATPREPRAAASKTRATPDPTATRSSSTDIGRAVRGHARSSRGTPSSRPGTPSSCHGTRPFSVQQLAGDDHAVDLVGPLVDLGDLGV